MENEKKYSHGGEIIGINRRKGDKAVTQVSKDVKAIVSTSSSLRKIVAKGFAKNTLISTLRNRANAGSRAKRHNSALKL